MTYIFILFALYIIIAKVLPLVARRALGGMIQQMQNGQQGQQQPQNPPAPKPSPRVKKGDYIDYEEVK